MSVGPSTRAKRRVLSHEGVGGPPLAVRGQLRGEGAEGGVEHRRQARAHRHRRHQERRERRPERGPHRHAEHRGEAEPVGAEEHRAERQSVDLGTRREAAHAGAERVERREAAGAGTPEAGGDLDGGDAVHLVAERGEELTAPEEPDRTTAEGEEDAHGGEGPRIVSTERPCVRRSPLGPPRDGIGHGGLLFARGAADRGKCGAALRGATPRRCWRGWRRRAGASAIEPPPDPLRRRGERRSRR